VSFSKKGDISNCCTASSRYKKPWYGMFSDAPHKTIYRRKILLIWTTWYAGGDVDFIVTAIQSKVWNKLKRGRGSIRGGPTWVASESIRLEDILTGETFRQCRYFKMKQLEGLKADEIEGFVQENWDKSSVLFSDMSTSCT
jgi:hypothetical protein